MVRKGGHRADEETVVDRIVDALERGPSGMHVLGEPSIDVPLEWPPALADVYHAFDGARLFNEALVLRPIAEVERDGADWVVGDLGGDEIRVDKKGRVWRQDDATGDRIIDGSAFDRWLHGAIDAEGLLYDGDGEFAEDVFDDDGELTGVIEQARLRAQLKRDARASGPRWRLARLIGRQGQVDRARRELEDVVAQLPEFSWAWLDLARLGEQAGELDGAYDEALMAAEAAERADHEQTGYFWAQAARLAARRGAEADRARCAAKALAANAGLVRAQLAGAEQNLADGDLASARGLMELARAVAPRDLSGADLSRRLDAAEAQAAVAKAERAARGEGDVAPGGREDDDDDDDDLDEDDVDDDVDDDLEASDDGEDDGAEHTTETAATVADEDGASDAGDDDSDDDGDDDALLN